MGDLLFSIANLSRKLGIEPETALRKANDKFTQRFGTLEQSVDRLGTSDEGDDARGARSRVAAAKSSDDDDQVHEAHEGIETRKHEEHVSSQTPFGRSPSLQHRDVEVDQQARRATATRADS